MGVVLKTLAKIVYYLRNFVSLILILIDTIEKLDWAMIDDDLEDYDGEDESESKGSHSDNEENRIFKEKYFKDIRMHSNRMSSEEKDFKNSNYISVLISYRELRDRYSTSN